MDKSLLAYKGIKPLLTGLAVLTALQGLFIIIQAYFLADVITSLFKGGMFHTVTSQLCFFFLALVLRQTLAFLKNRLTYQFAANTSGRLRKSVLKKIFQFGPSLIKEEGSGQTVTLIMEGTMKFRHYLELLLPKMMNAALIPAIVCLFVFYENVRSAVILVIAVPILIVFMVLLGVAAREKANRQYKTYQMLSNHFVDSLRGIETLKILGLSRRHAHNIRYVSEQYRKSVLSTLRIAFLSTFALDFFTMLSVATIAVFLGVGLINGTMDLKTALTVLVLAPEYFLPIREVGADYHATLDGKEAGEKIQEILQMNDTEIGKESIPAWDSMSKFSVKNMSYRFSDGRKGLEDINFTINGNQKVGIIGASGAGKSTLINLLAGFMDPADGEFTINGTTLAHLMQEDWQKQSTYIPQHPYLFSDTVFNNICFYQPNAAENEVNAAVRSAGLTDVVKSMPDGLKTYVGEGGRMLSGGQEQRIAIARAFLGNRPILLFDEPTAHLDIETEYQLKETILQLFEGKLVFFATHRLHWMLEMDQILVLDHGKLVEVGTHEQLWKQKGYYYRLVKAQLEGI